MNRHDDIPEDVSATARASASKCRSAIFHLTEKSAGVWAEDGVIEAMNEAFARAILAERERCAKVAEKHASPGQMWERDEMPTAKLAAGYAARDIAATIRRGVVR